MNLKEFGKSLPKIFFIGIGGISMSALAKYLAMEGFEVSGSDRAESEITDRLTDVGCNIYIGHNKDNLINQDIVVYNSAIDSENEELKYAIENKKCLLKRVELLQMIADCHNLRIGISGSHGKTTTTAILSHILLRSDIAFTTHIGGLDNCLGNLFLNGKDVFVSEICEYDKNIDKATSDIAVVLNIDNDHLNSFDGIDDLTNSFYGFLKRAKTAIISIDDERLKKYPDTCITCSLKQSANYSAQILDSQKNCLNVRFFENGAQLFESKLKIMGEYNVYNALIAVAAARVLKIPSKIILEGLSSFIGVKRRNELIGNINGAAVLADYAHHPKELECSLNSFLKNNSNVITIFQPHTFSRTKILFEDFLKVFSQIENLYLYKTYAARENPEIGYSAEFLARALKCENYFDDFDSLISNLEEVVTKNNTILILGAGDLYDKIKQRLESK